MAPYDSKRRLFKDSTGTLLWPAHTGQISAELLWGSNVFPPYNGEKRGHSGHARNSWRLWISLRCGALQVSRIQKHSTCWNIFTQLPSDCRQYTVPAQVCWSYTHIVCTRHACKHAQACTTQIQTDTCCTNKKPWANCQNVRTRLKNVLKMF